MAVHVAVSDALSIRLKSAESSVYVGLFWIYERCSLYKMVLLELKRCFNMMQGQW